MTEMVTSGSMRGSEKRSNGAVQTGTKLETADTAKAAPVATALRPDSTEPSSGMTGLIPCLRMHARIRSPS